MLESKLLRWVRNRFGRENRRKPDPFPPTELERSVVECFCARDSEGIERAVAGFYGSPTIKVAFDPSAVRHAMSCAWSRTQARGSCFTFPHLEPGHLLNTVVNRWLSLWELFRALDGPADPTGRVVINFNDAGVEPGLAFSGDSADYTLIPDPDFFKSRGYTQARQHFERDLQPWDQRSATVLWRGSSLGQKHHPVQDMPRARLCQIANAAPNDWFDIGIVDVFDVSDSDAARLRAAGLIKERVRWKRYNRYRFHIDIDGHANSFAGLFLKFLSGGLVLKVASPNKYRQWYYDRLKPWEHFVPLRSDLGDLLEVAAYCRENDGVSQRIARRGLELASSLTFEKEFAGAIESVKTAFSAA